MNKLILFVSLIITKSTLAQVISCSSPPWIKSCVSKVDQNCFTQFCEPQTYQLQTLLGFDWRRNDSWPLFPAGSDFDNLGSISSPFEDVSFESPALAEFYLPSFKDNDPKDAG